MVLEGLMAMMTSFYLGVAFVFLLSSFYFCFLQEVVHLELSSCSALGEKELLQEEKNLTRSHTNNFPPHARTHRSFLYTISSFQGNSHVARYSINISTHQKSTPAYRTFALRMAILPFLHSMSTTKQCPFYS